MVPISPAAQPCFSLMKWTVFQRQVLPRLLYLPGLAEVVAMNDQTARPAHRPDVFADHGNRMKIDIRERFVRKSQFCKTPLHTSALRTGEDQSALAHGNGPGADHFQAEDAAIAERIDICFAEIAVAQRGHLAPGAGHRAGLPIGKIACVPGATALAGNSLPGFAAVVGLKHAGWENSAAIAASDAVTVIEETHVIQARNALGTHLFPFQAAVGGGQNDTGAPSALAFDSPNEPA